MSPEPTSKHAAKPDLPLQHTHVLTIGQLQTSHKLKNYAGTSSKYHNASTPTKEIFARIPSNEQKVGKGGGDKS